MMSVMRTGLATVVCLVLEACATPQLFQSHIMHDVDTQFDFHAWREAPSTSKGRKVQLGGRIVEVEPTENGVLIIADQLPIVEHPAYGPTAAGRRPGVFEFAFLYPGQIESSALTGGNRFIVVGTIQGAKAVMVGGARKSEPYLIARCVHIWKTQGNEISDFPMVGADYYPLEENTYCAASLEPETR